MRQQCEGTALRKSVYGPGMGWPEGEASERRAVSIFERTGIAVRNFHGPNVNAVSVQAEGRTTQRTAWPFSRNSVYSS